MNKETSERESPQLPKMYKFGIGLFQAALITFLITLLLFPVTLFVPKKLIEIHFSAMNLFLIYGLTFCFLGLGIIRLAQDPRKFCDFLNEKDLRPIPFTVFCITVLFAGIATKIYIQNLAGVEFDISFHLFLLPALIAFFVCATIIFRYQAIFEKEKTLPKEE